LSSSIADVQYCTKSLKYSFKQKVAAWPDFTIKSTVNMDKMQSEGDIFVSMEKSCPAVPALKKEPLHEYGIGTHSQIRKGRKYDNFKLIYKN
jgi:hypothetical protein